MQGAFNYFANINYLMLEANSSCNLACASCNRSELEKFGLREAKTLSEEELRKILSIMKRTKVDTIKFEGLSEPMLNPKFDLMCGVLREYFPRAFVIIATNLQYSLEKTAFLRTIPYVDMVYLSIDGTGEVYERARAGAQYAKLLKSLNDVRDRVEPADRKKKLHINFVLTADNYQELPKVYEIKDKFGLGSVRVNLAQNWNEGENNKLAPTRDMIEVLKNYRDDIKGVGGWDFRDCFWPFNGLIVDVFGDVRQCIINTSMRPVGNIFRDNIEEIYNQGVHFGRVRGALSQNLAPHECRNCDYKFLSPILREIFGGQGPLPPRAVVRPEMVK